MKRERRAPLTERAAGAKARGRFKELKGRNTERMGEHSMR